MMKQRIFIMTVTLMAAFVFSGTAIDASAQNKKVKDLEEELARLRDSIKIQNDEIEALREENLKIKIGSSLFDAAEDTTDISGMGVAQEEYTVELTDSLLNLWYAHQMAAQADDEIYDMDVEKFASNVPDEVYIERLKKMNSFIQIPYNDIVRSYIILYSEKMPKKMPYMLGLCKYYMPIFEEIFDQYGLPIELKAMAIIESAMDPRAESRVGAKGMWQFMYQTAKGYGLHVDTFVDERMDPIKSCEAAAQYLSNAYNMFGDWNLAIASYNCGAGNVQKAIKRAGGSRKFWDIWPYLPTETRSYVPAFVGALYTLEYYKEHGLKPQEVSMPVATDTLVINKQLHLKQVSEITGAPLDQLKNLNPQYRHEIIPGHEREYILRIPYQYTGSFIELEDTLYKHKAEIFFDPVTIQKIKQGGDGVRITHKVKSGEYLGKIASKYNVSIAKIKKWNNLKSDNIRVGQNLIIYRGGSGPATSQSSTSTSSSTSKSSSTAKSTSTSTAKSSAKGHTTYTVKSGDTFYSIAKNYPGVSAQNIMDYNGISSSKLRPGMVIKIPKY